MRMALHPILLQQEVPSWEKIIRLFERFGAPAPSVKLRDELVVILERALETIPMGGAVPSLPCSSSVVPDCGMNRDN